MAVRFRKSEIAPSFLALALGVALVSLVPLRRVQAQRNAVVERASPKEFGPGSQGNLRTTLGFEAQSFASQIPDRPNLGSSTLLKVGVQYETGKENWGGKLDFTAGRYIDLRYNTLSVREAYVSYGKIFNPNQVTSSQMNFSLGRKIEFWSEVDNQWDLGLWEPKYLEEPLRPEKQGIAGLQFNFQDPSGLEFAAYASPIFIPTMNPPLAVEEGAFVSDSRWTRPPSSSTSLIGKDTRLVYDLQIPEISQLISKPGAGARLSWGRNQSQGFWISTNFARKPINALALKYDYKLAISSASAEGMVNVGPTVSYHSVWGADLGWKSQDLGLSVSYLEDGPEESLPQDQFSEDGIARTEWIQQQPQPAQIYGAHADWNVRGLARDPIRLQLDYLKANTSDTQDVNSLGEDRGALIPHRLTFTHAIQFRAESLVFAGRTPILLSWRYLRELDQKGNIYSLGAKVFATRTLTFHGGFDVLGPDDGSLENQDGRFLNTFRTNDRVFGGMSYVF